MRDHYATASGLFPETPNCSPIRDSEHCIQEKLLTNNGGCSCDCQLDAAPAAQPVGRRAAALDRVHVWLTRASVFPNAQSAGTHRLITQPRQPASARSYSCTGSS